jgi:hypothetical protein
VAQLERALDLFPERLPVPVLRLVRVIRRSEIERTLLGFLDCGVPDCGFARVRCPSCRQEFLVALSCKMRGFCASCHAKRSVLWAEWLTQEVLLPVRHLQWVFTIPKRLRLLPV